MTADKQSQPCLIFIFLFLPVWPCVPSHLQKNRKIWLLKQSTLFSVKNPRNTGQIYNKSSCFSISRLEEMRDVDWWWNWLVALSCHHLQGKHLVYLSASIQTKHRYILYDFISDRSHKNLFSSFEIKKPIINITLIPGIRIPAH